MQIFSDPDLFHDTNSAVQRLFLAEHGACEPQFNPRRRFHIRIRVSCTSHAYPIDRRKPPKDMEVRFSSLFHLGTC